MTIYILHPDPTISAQMLDDKSLDRQIKDIAQVLCNVHHLIEMRKIGTNDVGDPYPDIPLNLNIKFKEWDKWTIECKANYLWMVEYSLECSNEWSWRRHLSQMIEPEFHKQHSVLEWAQDNIPDLPVNTTCHCYDKHCPLEEMTPYPLVMPKKYHAELYAMINPPKLLGVDAIQSYRNYYQTKLQQRIHKCYGCRVEVELNEKDPFCHLAKWSKREKPDWLRV